MSLHANWRPRLGVVECIALSLLASLSACTPAAFGVNEDAVSQARAAGVPIVVDSVEIFRGRSNDTSLRLELTSVDSQTVVSVVMRSALIGVGGRPLTNQSSGASVLELHLGTGFDSRHAGVWGPFFVGPTARCLEVHSIEVSLETGRRIILDSDNGLDVALAHAKGPVCR